MGGLEKRRMRAALAAAVALAVLVLGCAHSSQGDGVFHTVRRGESIFRISRYYQVSASSILEANQIRDERSLEIGERLWIPGARRRPPTHPLLPAPASADDAREQARNDAIQNANLYFAWPLRGRLSGGFGTRKGRPHEGIDLAAKPGTLIRAAESGRVIYSGNGLGAYGNVVIVSHSDLYATVYAHNRKNRVRKGAYVDQGEVRDPLDYLP
jgi:lipoprotein NlpD